MLINWVIIINYSLEWNETSTIQSQTHVHATTTDVDREVVDCHVVCNMVNKTKFRIYSNGALGEILF